MKSLSEFSSSYWKTRGKAKTNQLSISKACLTAGTTVEVESVSPMLKQ